jgi:membrane-associated phospholipid phosphatase
MNRRLLVWVAAIFAALAAIGLLGADRPLAEWVRSSGIEQARFFAWGLAALDFASGISLWFWLAGCVALAIGALGLAVQRQAHWPRAFLAAGVVQIATLQTMILGKDHFGRLRPHEVFDRGDWSAVWFAGGNSFPSGHSAFYFGLLLPLAAKHFLSDVSTSAVIAAIYALLLATVARRWLPAPSPRSA